MRRLDGMAPQVVVDKISRFIGTDFSNDRDATVQTAQVNSRVRGTASHAHPKPVCRLQLSFPRKGINRAGKYIRDQYSEAGHIHNGISVRAYRSSERPLKDKFQAVL